MKIIYILVLFFGIHTVAFSQTTSNYPIKQMTFLQEEILLNEQIIFHFYTNSTTSFDIIGLDKTLFIKGSIIDEKGKKYTEYFFPSVNLFLRNDQMNDYKDLFHKMAQSNVFDVHLNIDQLQLIQFIVTNNQYR